MFSRLLVLAVFAGAASSPKSTPAHHVAGATAAASSDFDVDAALDGAHDEEDEDIASSAHSIETLGSEHVPSLPAVPKRPVSRPYAGSPLRASGGPPTGRSAASMQFMITMRMKEQLRGLGYLPSEIANLDPQRAAAIIDRSIPRPSRGVPDSWLVNGRAARRRRPGAILKAAAAGMVKVGFSASLGLILYLSCGGQLPTPQQHHVDRVGRLIQKAIKRPTRYYSPSL
eukprot:scaffold63129_cov33-Tisochrysis_lutea.AAC.1